MKNWKTTVGGIMGAIGAVLITQDSANLKLIGSIMSAVGVFLLGASAKDHNSQ